MSEVKLIEPRDLNLLHEKGEKLYVVDVRTPDEYQEVRAAIVAELMPLDRFDPEQLSAQPSDNIFFICRSGRRSYEAASQAAIHGFEEVYNVEGGTLEWEAQGLPIERG